ncbi:MULTISPECIES: hypothetical protein [Limnochorda]|uniref:hypothetical protein n=1 Tax=Limnochorda TaxID=1676651 RepID=UPI00181971A7|nr:hypothetical protein [Limnochorda pilosa]MBO2485721.1 hypothetical protein [Bacillota bacterium]MBO2518245.1 hypothetical protein [Bacillota bacterium]NMA70936.1 hypothetical protein [Bacillota bacterium]
MSQEPDRQILLAFFPSRAQAEAAKAALGAAGFHQLHIDRVSRHARGDASILTNPLTGSFTSLAPGGGDGPEEAGAPLMGPVPGAGSSGLETDAPEKGYLLTIVAPARELDRAELVVREHGGLL